MYSIAIAFVTALVVTAALTPLVRHFALAAGAVDEPTARRVHTRRVPRLGGVAIVVGFMAPLLTLVLLRTGFARVELSQHYKLLAGLLLGSVVIALLGFVDDVSGVGAKRKLLVQSIAACIAYAGGLRIGSLSLPFVGEVTLGWLSLPATVLWIAAVSNALNLIDGLDGLAAGVAFFACVTNFVVAYLSHNLMICLFSAALAGAILGFLIYNFNPATIFMGDSGSLFLGYVLATMSLLGSSSQKSPTAIAILVPLLALGLPLMDMLLAMVRRFLERRSIFSADRGHLHHRLLDLGLTHRRAVLVLYALSLVFTLLALVVHLGRSWQIGVALVALTATLVSVVRFTRYFTAAIARRESKQRDALTEALRKVIPIAIARIHDARTREDVWPLLKEYAEEVELLAVELAPEGVAVTDPARLRWESPKLVGSRDREAVSAQFSFKDEHDVTFELTFFHDSADGVISPQSEILLQLLCDATAHAFGRRERLRKSSRSGHLRPV
jgi:UDP-GlcNAc:undecaprenyl-phosphate GlcNAc-1-phosphate transferase